MRIKYKQKPKEEPTYSKVELEQSLWLIGNNYYVPVWLPDNKLTNNDHYALARMSENDSPFGFIWLGVLEKYTNTIDLFKGLSETYDITLVPREEHELTIYKEKLKEED